MNIQSGLVAMAQALQQIATPQLKPSQIASRSFVHEEVHMILQGQEAHSSEVALKVLQVVLGTDGQGQIQPAFVENLLTATTAKNKYPK